MGIEGRPRLSTALRALVQHDEQSHGHQPAVLPRGGASSGSSALSSTLPISKCSRAFLSHKLTQERSPWIDITSALPNQPEA